MKLSIQHLLFAPLLVVMATSANAAESTDMAVKGTIRPAACNLSLSNDGLIDFQTISGTSLAQSAPTELAQKEVTMTVDCDAETYVAVTLVDNRAGTVPSNVLKPAIGIDARLPAIQARLTVHPIDRVPAHVVQLHVPVAHRIGQCAFQQQGATRF